MSSVGVGKRWLNGNQKEGRLDRKLIRLVLLRSKFCILEAQKPFTKLRVAYVLFLKFWRFDAPNNHTAHAAHFSGDFRLFVTT